MSKKKRRPKKKGAPEKDHISRHHIVNRCRGGRNTPDNILRLWFYEKHVHWHALFDNRDIQEVIELLKRVDRAVKNKGGQDERHVLSHRLPE